METTVRKPKRIATAPDPFDDPEISRTIAAVTAKPECSPLAGSALARQEAERKRRQAERAIDSEGNGKNGKWVFVKNGNWREPITLEDGSTLVFPGTLFFTEDKEKAEALLKVAHLYNVCLK